MKAMMEIRRSLRPWLDQVSAGEKVLVGVSGGIDSMALAYALYQECGPRAIVAIPVVIDHGLQEGSAEIAHAVGSRLASVGYPKVEIRRVQVEMADGLEGSARRARYESFHALIDHHGARYLFLGHTEDDQAETVLLGLARGSGTRSLSGMAKEIGPFIRPMLDLPRVITASAVTEAGLVVWEDPHNSNQKFTRSRVRHQVLPLLEAELGPGIAPALARTAKILREDADALDLLANEFLDRNIASDLDVAQLMALPKAIRARVLRMAIYQVGAPAGSLSADHLAPIEALITGWKGQGPSSLPGGVKVERLSGRLSLSRGD